MILFIAGASHTGKTALAQKLLETYKFPYLSIDHLKMGLIRSGNTSLTPVSDDRALTDYLWPIDWQKDFGQEYRDHIKYICLVMSENYIRNHFDNIRKYAGVIEDRGDDEDCTMESVLADNAETLRQCRAHNADYILIDETYEVNYVLSPA